MLDIEKLIEQAIGPDDSFRFHCTACGKCCKNREDILLNPFDLHRIAEYLDMEMGQVVQKYCIWYIGQTSKLPVVAVNMRGPERVCPFLENNKCKIHAAKPTVCALYPLGRVAIPASNGSSDKESGIRYLAQDVDCGTDEDEQTVREWLEGYGLEDSEVWFSEWQKTITPLCQRMNDIAEKVTEGTLQMLGQIMLIGLYVGYNREGDFMDQFHDNVRGIENLLSEIESVMPSAGLVK